MPRNRSSKFGNDAQIESSLAQIAKKTSNSAGKLMINGLKSGNQSQVFTVIGDSTGNETTEWVYLLGQKLKSDYPNYNIEYRLINTSSWNYNSIIKINDVGERRHLVCSGGTGYVYMIPESYVNYTGSDIDVRFEIKSDFLDDGNQQNIIAKFYGGGHRCWRIYKGNTNKLTLEYTTDGTNIIGINTNVDMTLWSKTDIHNLRFVFDADNGSGQNVLTVYRSTDDGYTWTVLDTKTNTGTVSLFQDPTVDYAIGAYQQGVNPFKGRIYSVKLMNGIDGNDMMPFLFEDWQQPNATPVIQYVSGTPTLHIFNASVPGYSTTEFNLSLLKKCVVNAYNSVIFISLSHNQLKMIGRNLYSAYDTLVTNIKSLVYEPKLVFLTQNPKSSTAQFTQEHEKRRQNICFYADKNSHIVIDTYAVFAEAVKKGTPFDTLVNSDGIHPTQDGSKLWSNTVYDYLA